MLAWGQIEAITERLENSVGSGKGGSVLVQVRINNVVMKYRKLVRTLKQTRVEQVILSGILPVIGRRGSYISKLPAMAVNMLFEKLCREEEVGFVDLWGNFVGRAEGRASSQWKGDSSICGWTLSSSRQWHG